MEPVMPAPAAAFSALAMTKSMPELAPHPRHPLLHDLAARLAHDVADEEELQHAS